MEGLIAAVIARNPDAPTVRLREHDLDGCVQRVIGWDNSDRATAIGQSTKPVDAIRKFAAMPGVATASRGLTG